MQPKNWGLLTTTSTLYSVAFVFLSIYCETGLILLLCGLFIFFSFFLKENPTNNNEVTDLEFNRSVHKLFSDRMSKNVCLHTQWIRWFQLTWLDISVTAQHERFWIVFWLVKVDDWLSCYLYCQPLFYTFTFSNSKTLINHEEPPCKAK